MGRSARLRSAHLRTVLSRGRFPGQRHSGLRPGIDAGPANRSRPWRRRNLRAAPGRRQLFHAALARGNERDAARRTGEVSPSQRPRPLAREHDQRFTGTLVKCKILIVEDDPHIRLGLEEILKGEGYEVNVCSRGDKAVEAVMKCQPALIVLDVMLPGLSGYDVSKELRARKITTPILMLTAKGQEMDKVIGLDLGADDYMTKPFGVRELVARINALLRRGHGVPTTAHSIEPFQIGAST